MIMEENWKRGGSEGGRVGVMQVIRALILRTCEGQFRNLVSVRTGAFLVEKAKHVIFSV